MAKVACVKRSPSNYSTFYYGCTECLNSKNETHRQHAHTHTTAQCYHKIHGCTNCRLSSNMTQRLNAHTHNTEICRNIFNACMNCSNHTNKNRKNLANTHTTHTCNFNLKPHTNKFNIQQTTKFCSTCQLTRETGIKTIGDGIFNFCLSCKCLV